MREENIALIKQGYEAFAKSDLEFFRETFADEILWHTPGYGQLEPEYKGIDAVLGYFTKLVELTGGTFRNVSEAQLADDERVASLDHLTATRNGEQLDTRIMHLYQVRDGKVIEVTTFVSQPERNAAFWA